MTSAGRPYDFNAERMIWQGDILRTSIKEFLRALAVPYTYNIARNAYVLFGIFCGLPIPVFSIGIYMIFRSIPLSVPNYFKAVVDHPILLILILHPILFGIIFGAMGTIKAARDHETVRLFHRVQGVAAELEKANEKLRELDRMKDEILANVTHELKTPLISISGYNEMLLEERLGPLNTRQKEGMKTSLRNVERLLSLIDQMLELAKIDAGRMGIFPTTFGIREMMRNAAASLAPLLEKKKIRLESSEPRDEAPVSADREKIWLVVTNILSNAVKFTEEGGRIATSIATDGDRVRVTVEDTGCGISDQLLPRIFDRFWQADGSGKRKHGGVGLGLAIVKEFLDAHGCPISVKSRVGVGTSISFTLPAARTAAIPVNR